ncbi:serine/threonine-protein kinase [Acrocarpospora sp. B8E8]|uniref:serine/threonine-protein kinase n=1 Tax=Acrocarpospora sp. B8E8 TaxID=3153572 RepID=UPI00325D41D1
MQPLTAEDPRQVGRYRIGGRLGEGGMGQVFWGRSPSGRAVAVKLVRRELVAQPDFRRRFAQEIEAARRVGGFHTAPLVDADPGGERPWLVTAYVAGPPLATALARHGALPPPSLRVLAAGLAEALEAIHAAGVIHRDLKPTNILLVDDGPRVIDFGIARALDGAAITGTGMHMGTPGFMAPEQFTGQPVTAMVDVFALGVVLCHAAGTHPFGRGPAASLTHRIISEEPDLSAVPDDLRDLVADCLRKDPAARPAAADLLARLAHSAAPGEWLPPAMAPLLAEHTLPDHLPSGTGTAVPNATPPYQRESSETVSRTAIAQTSTPESWDPAPSRRKPSHRLLLGAAAVILAIATASLVVYQTYAGGGERTVVGTWSGTDTDGSDLTLEVVRSEGAQDYQLALQDTRATVCNGSPATIMGPGALTGDTLTTTYTITCPSAALDTVDIQYQYDPAKDTLTDNTGVILTRVTP